MSLLVSIKIQLGNFKIEAEHEFSNNKVTAIVGPSGSGKTSLIRSIAGLNDTCRGEITFDNGIWLNENINLPTYKRGISYVSQDAYLFPHLSVGKQLIFSEKRSSGVDQLYKRYELIDVLGIEHLLQHYPGNLSGGQKQLVATARALLSQPRFLLLDEPVSALDKNNRTLVLKHLLKLKQSYQLGMLIVSHHPEELLRLADDLVYMEDGRIVFADSYVNALTNSEQALAQSEEAFSIIECESCSYDKDANLLHFTLDGLSLHLPAQHLPENLNSPFRLRVLAKDVSISLERSKRTSILNILPATIIQTKKLSDGQALITTKLLNQHVLARISTWSLSHLSLQPGMPVFLQIKALALLN